MSAIERIIKDILEKGQQEVETFTQEKKEKLAASFKQEKEALKFQQEKAINNNERQTNALFQQKENRLQLEIKNELLIKKQEYLEQLFSEVIEQMNKLSLEEFQSFADQVMKQLPLKGKIHVCLGTFSTGKISQQWLDERGNEGQFFYLSKETIPEEGGLVFSKEGVDYNFLFSSLVKEIKKTESFAVAERLFQPEVNDENTIV